MIKNKITKIISTGRIISNTTIEVRNSSKSNKIKAKHILIATSVEVINIPEVKVDENSIVSSTNALSLPKVAKEIVIIGGSYISLELRLVWKRLGNK